MNLEELAHLIQRSLKQSSAVHIDGLGVFERDRDGAISLRNSNRPRVFIAYVIEDAVFADRLYKALSASGFYPWMDRRKLLPGQDWPRRIEDAIASSDFFIACFSANSVRKKGAFQAEIRYALDCANRSPLDDVFLIPARLDNCRVPARIQKETEYVDLFPDWEAGLDRILQIIDCQMSLVA
jgi:hypothetical protein